MTAGTAITVVPDTGEIIPASAFNVAQYLESVSSPAAFSTQQSLMAAYDAAVAQLVGPNDVQQAQGKEFKKKSAWRKLARHFNISTKLVRYDHATVGEDEVFVVVMRATAPWGQVAEAIGSCGMDEETGRREITYADAYATAQTRATNRAIADLIAMGEVSAEEIGERRRAPSPRPAAAAAVLGKAASGTKVATVPFGDTKGTPLTALSTDALQKLERWYLKDEATTAKWQERLKETQDELAARGAGDPGDGES